MFKDKVNGLQVKIPNGTYTDLGPLLLEVRFEYPKLFAEGSGRNLSGTMIADYIGIFPKIICEFGPLSKSQLEPLIKILDNPKQILKYYDPNKQTYVEMETYTGDYTITNRNIISGDALNEGFEISFIAIKKRS